MGDGREQTRERGTRTDPKACDEREGAWIATHPRPARERAQERERQRDRETETERPAPPLRTLREGEWIARHTYPQRARASERTGKKAHLRHLEQALKLGDPRGCGVKLCTVMEKAERITESWGERGHVGLDFF